MNLNFKTGYVYDMKLERVMCRAVSACCRQIYHECWHSTGGLLCNVPFSDHLLHIWFLASQKSFQNENPAKDVEWNIYDAHDKMRGMENKQPFEQPEVQYWSAECATRRTICWTNTIENKLYILQLATAACSWYWLMLYFVWIWKIKAILLSFWV